MITSNFVNWNSWTRAWAGFPQAHHPTLRQRTVRLLWMLVMVALAAAIEGWLLFVRV